MGAANTLIHDLAEYKTILDQHPLVIVLFKSPYCAACMGVDRRFNRIADNYAGRVKSLLLDTTQLPKIEGVEGTPTLVVYRNGQEVENLKGVGSPDEQETVFEDVFSDYCSKEAATPASPAAPQPQPPSNASPHVPGYRRPRAGGRAGSSLNRRGSDKRRSRRP